MFICAVLYIESDSAPGCCYKLAPRSIMRTPNLQQFWFGSGVRVAIWVSPYSYSEKANDVFYVYNSTNCPFGLLEISRQVIKFFLPTKSISFIVQLAPINKMTCYFT